jgi:GNAT superfamily N-acetyltransferase
MAEKELSFDLRHLERRDFQKWKNLWQGYLNFYESTVQSTVYETTFKRLISKNNFSQKAIVATHGETFVGLAHYIFHPHNWKIEDVCYLQDLYVLPKLQGCGIGRALIEAVYSSSDQQNIPTVYWLTQDFNKQARMLYDNIATVTPFIKYNRY